ncbi:MAG: glycine cleavage system protein GcvH [Halofilum sp. (in: g-proteobacteria)]|nr:glycine cleavage system protein GcvH [Halofilum sp. (in: g-proteobacteria)]
MNQVPSELKYTRDHEWVRVDDDGTVTIGITDHAQQELGDLVFVEVPEVGTTFAAGDAAAVVESVKAASDVYAPLSGEVVEANDELADAPETINNDAFGEGWIFRLKIEDGDSMDELMSADEYEEFINSDDD